MNVWSLVRFPRKMVDHNDPFSAQHVLLTSSMLVFLNFIGPSRTDAVDYNILSF